jgi:hypothetical protein
MSGLDAEKAANRQKRQLIESNDLHQDVTRYRYLVGRVKEDDVLLLLHGPRKLVPLGLVGVATWIQGPSSAE